MGPVAMPSGGGLGAPTVQRERTNATDDHELGRTRFANAVMTNLARRKGTKATVAFIRAYRFDAARRGWQETPWGSAQVTRLYGAWTERSGHGEVTAAALSRAN